MSQRLAGKSVWISGGASGIGEAVAQRFAREGAAVAIADVQEKAGQVVTERICQAGGRAIFVHGDVSNEQAVSDSIGATVDAFASLHIVVNCAGVITIRPLHQTTEDDWDRMMGVNLKSMFFAFKHAHPHLIQNQRSYVVNIGSISSFSAQRESASYIASKHAVLGLTRAIAMDYASHGIRCNCICPGITDTPMLRFHMNTMPDPEEALNARLRRVPMGVAMQPDDIAKAALYLASEDSSGITGTMLTVDGGYTAGPEWQHPGHTSFMEPADRKDQ